MEGTPFGRYRLVELLGRGGMGEVWRAFDTAIDRVVALKVLPPHFADDQVFQERFRREARAAAGLNEPHVVPIHDFGQIDGRLYVTMRLIEGRDLQTLLADGPLQPERAVRIIEQVASALDAAHQIGLVHRDVKPSNILIADEDFAYLIDFGIARAAQETGLTSTGVAVGTWAYMAPERFRAGQIDPRSDVYALACVLHECLTGQRPFPGDSLEQLAVGHMFTPPPRPTNTNHRLPPAVDDVIATGLAKEPDQRYPTTKDLARAARGAVTDPIARPRAPTAPTLAVPNVGQQPPAGASTRAPEPAHQPWRASSAPTQQAQPTPAIAAPPPTPPSSPPADRQPPSVPQFTGRYAPPPRTRGRRNTMALTTVGAFVVLAVAVTAVLIFANRPSRSVTSGTTTTTGKSGTSTVVADCVGKKALTASGATAQANAMTRFINAYETACPGYTLTYTSSGSGAGVSEFIGGYTDFGGSDAPLNAEKGEVEKAAQRCDGNPVWNLPTVFGAIAISYNVAGVDGLVLDGPTLAKIFNGTVATWDAPEIRALNSDAALPAQPIAVIFRTDESGTTDSFQKYLEAASDGAWRKGTGKAFNGGVGEGAKGNEGTSAAVKNTPGAITYNEWSFAKSQNLQIAKIVTSAGPDPVQLSAESAGKSINNVKIKGQGNDLVLDTSSFYRPTEAGSYPIVLATYEIVCSKYLDAEVASAVKAFLTVAIGPGQKGLEDNGYIPIPDGFKQRLLQSIDAIR